MENKIVNPQKMGKILKKGPLGFITILYCMGEAPKQVRIKEQER